MTPGWRARRCWGRTYPSRTLQNYKDSPWGRGMFARLFGTTQRDWAFQQPTTTESDVENALVNDGPGAGDYLRRPVQPRAAASGPTHESPGRRVCALHPGLSRP